MYKPLFISSLILITSIINCPAQHVYDPDETSIKPDKTIKITLNNVNFETYDSLPSLDSLEHMALFASFDELRISRRYNKSEPLKKYKQLNLFPNITTLLLLEHFKYWGSKIYLINYHNNGTPKSAYLLISCGGDGGYYSCSNAFINKESCKIIYRGGEPIEDFRSFIEFESVEYYSFDNSYNLILKSHESKVDTIR